MLEPNPMPIFSLWDKKNYGHCIYVDGTSNHYAEEPNGNLKLFASFTDAYNYICRTYNIPTTKNRR